MTELAELVVGDVYERSDWGAPATPGGSRRDREQVVGWTQHHTSQEGWEPPNAPSLWEVT